ncbi:MAG: polysaccharide deacetylase family protein, partial [Burkholderiales bacterium]
MGMYKRLLKRGLQRLLELSGVEQLRDSVWQRHALHPACILCFHRVTDAIPEDGITITPGRFAVVIEAIARDYAPVSLRSLVENIEQGRPWPRRAVAITFDDGYLDNYEIAAPILKKFSVPCTFFVAAHLMGSETVLPWDRHLAGKVPWMQWFH